MSRMSATVDAVVRVLIVVRLSNLTEETTSPERQLEICRDFLSRQPGWAAVGVVEDLDVSATSVPPFERPKLREWFDHRFNEYDVMLVWRADRVIRSMFDFVDIYRWGEKAKVHFVSATEAHFDTRSDMGKNMGVQAAMFAEMEAKAIKQRTKETFDYLMRNGHYRGGMVPWGYKADKQGTRWALVIDPEYAEIIRDCVKRVLAGDRPNKIAADLNRDGVLTQHDRQRLLAGRFFPRKAQLWRSGNLARALRSPTLRGYAVTHQDDDGKRLDVAQVLRNPDGSPIVRSEPILDQATFDLVSAALDAMGGKRGVYAKSTTLLLRVAFCGVCDRALNRTHGRGGSYYRCPSTSYGIKCGNRGVPESSLDDIVESVFLKTFGALERHVREWQPGSDASAELAEVDAELTALVALVGSPAYRSGSRKAALDARIESLGARAEELEKTETTAAGYVMVSTGQTVADFYRPLDVVAQNKFLREMETRVVVRNLPGEGISVAFGWGGLYEAVGRAGGRTAAEIDEILAADGIEDVAPTTWVRDVLRRHGEESDRLYAEEHGRLPGSVPL